MFVDHYQDRNAAAGHHPPAPQPLKPQFGRPNCDFRVFRAIEDPFCKALDVLLLVAEFALIFTLFQGCVLVESAAIRRQLLDEARRGHLAESTARTVSSWTQPTFRRWAPDDVDQVGYTGLAMRLGLRKEQATALAKHSASTRQTTEIQGLRDAMKAAWPARNP